MHLTNPVRNSSAGLTGNVNTLLGRHQLTLLSDNDDDGNDDNDIMIMIMIVSPLYWPTLGPGY